MSKGKLGTLANKKATPSRHYFGFWKAMQDSGDGRTQILDHSGKGRHLNIGDQGSYSAVTGTNAGFATIVGTPNAQDKTIYVPGTTENPKGSLLWDLFAGQSLIIAFTINGAAPGGNATVIGSRGAVTNVAGMALTVNATGLPAIVVRDTGTTFATNLPSAGDTLCDGNDHNIVVMIDGTSKKAYGWKDGAAWSTLTAGQAITAVAGSTQCDDPFRWGGAGDFVAGSQQTWINGQSVKLRNMHVLVVPSWPENYLEIMRALTNQIHRPLSSKILP